MAKRKIRKKSTQKKHTNSKNINFKLINILLLIIIALILAIAILIYLVDSKKIDKSKEKIVKIEKKIQNDLNKIQDTSEEKLNKYMKNVEVKKDAFEEYTEDLYKEYIHEKKEKQTLKKDEIIDVKSKDNTLVETEKELTTKEESVFHKPLAIKTNKPRLAIVIDDVTTQYQINKINDIGYKTTLSILPPTSRNGSTIKMVDNLPFYMIHFPMEAKYFKGEEQYTLHIKDSYEQIEKRVAQIRQWYPNAKFTNNHTGSKFTENKEAMDKLFKALKKYNFTFMDSRTTSKSAGKIMAEKYDMPYIARNIFLDNEQDFAYIQNQLKKSIRIAKKRGYAIAIGHPHEITIRVLKESKELLKDLELVYVNQLPIL